MKTKKSSRKRNKTSKPSLKTLKRKATRTASRMTRSAASKAKANPHLKKAIGQLHTLSHGFQKTMKEHHVEQRVRSWAKKFKNTLKNLSPEQRKTIARASIVVAGAVLPAVLNRMFKKA